MGVGDIVLMTDHGSGEGSQPLLEAAIEILTGMRPVSIDARHFMTGGNGRATAQEGALRLDVPSDNLVATPDVLVIYEIPPAERRRFEAFQRMLLNSGSTCLGADVDAWRAATDKHGPLRGSSAMASRTWRRSPCVARTRTLRSMPSSDLAATLGTTEDRSGR